MLSLVLNHPAILVHQDDLGRLHLRDTPETARLAEQFRQFQTGVLSRQITSSDPLCMAALVLLAFEGLATERDAVAALVACAEAYRYSGRHVLEWNRPTRHRDRRYLFPISAVCAEPLIGREISLPEARNAIRAAAALMYPGSATPAPDLFNAAIAWLQDEGFPGALIAHILGLAPMTVLPKSAFVREATRLAPRGDETHMLTSETVGLAIDAFFQASVRSGSAWAADRLKSACRYNSKLNFYRNKSDMLKECLALSRELASADASSALLVAWAADLVESGTERKPNMHPRTISKYVSCVASPLHASLRGDVLEWTPEEFASCYEKIIDASQSRRTAASALSSFHAFLMTFFDVAPLRQRLHRGIPEALPAANCIWEHEKHLMSNWIDVFGVDTRLQQQLKMALELFWHGVFRAQEVFHTQLCNVRTYGDGPIEIEVAPRARDGSPKSPSGRRVIVIADPDACRTIRAWHARRENEGALSSEYLFGDPHDPARIYRLGSLYSMLNQMVKAATGDLRASVHSFRHGGISRRVHDALLSSTIWDIEPLDEIATEAGHLCGITSIRHYTHQIEESLRLHLDISIRKCSISSSNASHWSKVSAVALRQRAFARQAPLSEICWRAIEDRPLSPRLPAVADGIETALPISPLSATAPGCPTYENVLMALSDIAARLGRDVVMQRNRLDETSLSAFEVAVKDNLLKLAPNLPPTAATCDAWHFVSTSLMNDRYGFDLCRIDQDKFKTIRKALSSMASDVGGSFAQAWVSCYCRTYLNLSDPYAADRLFAGLAHCDVGSQHLGLSISMNLEIETDSDALTREAKLQFAFQRSFNCKALVEYKRPRRGRPRDYLIWSSTKVVFDGTPASAAISVTGFNALMLAYSAYLTLKG